MRFSRTLMATMIGLSASAMVGAQSNPEPATPKAVANALPNGVEIRCGTLNEQITALRDDVLRIRAWRGDTPPEDASWAVLASARHAAVPVTADNTLNHFGFRTHALIVAVDPQTLMITVRDAAGEILQQDALPMRFDGDSFQDL